MRVLWITAVTVIIDQLAKIAVLLTMYRSQSIPVLGDWLKLTYTENPGMAFGITFGPKALVAIFSMVATLIIIIYLVRIRRVYTPYRASLALILGGALGNIVDRIFYGVILGYDSFFLGKVVDFIHIDLWKGYLPDAVPLVGGTYVALFPIWNVADMAIVCGVAGILFFQKKYHEQLASDRQQSNQAEGDPLSGSEAKADVIQAVTPVSVMTDGHDISQTQADDTIVPSSSMEKEGNGAITS